MNNTSKSLVVLLLLVAYASAHVSHYDDGERILQTDAQYPNIRFNVNYTSLESDKPGMTDYISQNLLPPIIDYLSSALRIKYPYKSNLVLPKSSTKICLGAAIPDLYYTTGVAADMAFMVITGYNESSMAVADAVACNYDPVIGRPYFGRVKFNTAKFHVTTDPIIHEGNMYTTMHEVFHALGFSGNAFSKFVDANGVQRTDVISFTQIDGKNVTVVNVEPLTRRLRNLIGCPSIPGAYMEDDGGVGNVGSHFERRIFMNEVMTSSTMTDQRVSELTLAMMEGSGWYVPDYNYAEPFYAGAGQGCDYYFGSCQNSQGQANFEEFCSKSEVRKCSASGRGGATCTADSTANGCLIPVPPTDYDCTSPSAIKFTFLPKVQVSGPGTTSRCFSGTLSSTTTANRASTYCFNFKCQGDGLATTLSVIIGDQTVKCSKEGSATVTGYAGTLDCPDPIKYCQTVGKPYCPRGCMGRGACIDNKCVCRAGFKGVDCSRLA